MLGTSKLTLVTLCGSVRTESYNASLLRALPKISAGDLDFQDGVSGADVPIYDGDLERIGGLPSFIVTLAEQIRVAHGVVIASPEYNYSLPGGLKNLLDWVSRTPDQPFAHKPVLIQSVSAGPLGGARMQYHLRQVLVSLNARVFGKPEIMIASAPSRFTSDGELIDPATREAVRRQLAEFAVFIRRDQPT